MVCYCVEVVVAKKARATAIYSARELRCVSQWWDVWRCNKFQAHTRHTTTPVIIKSLTHNERATTASDERANNNNEDDDDDDEPKRRSVYLCLALVIRQVANYLDSAGKSCVLVCC